VRQIRGNDRIDGDDEHVRTAGAFPKAGNLAPLGESSGEIDAPALPTVVGSPDDAVRDRLIGP
jgi:hypothetical protein